MWACQRQFQLLTLVPIFPNPNQAGNHSFLPWGIFTLEKLKKHWIPTDFKKYWVRMRAETKRSAWVYSKCMENTSKEDIGLSTLESVLLFFYCIVRCGDRRICPWVMHIVISANKALLTENAWGQQKYVCELIFCRDWGSYNNTIEKKENRF